MLSKWQSVFEFDSYEIKVQDGSGSIRLYCPDGSSFQFHLEHLERWLMTPVDGEASLNK